MNTVNAGDHFYNFDSEENAAKWKGVLIAALRRVLEQVHPSLLAREDALDYVESLCLRLLAMLCAKPSPHTVQDIEYRVQSTFPTPIDKWALREAQEALEKGKKKSVLPVDKIHNLLQKELLLYKVDSGVSLFLVAVLEYISADILKLAGNYVKNIKHIEITYEDVQISMNADKALMDMFYQDEGGGTQIPIESPVIITTAPRTSLTYEEVVRELIASEKAYIKELHMLIKVFREEIIKLSSDPKAVDLIFANIVEIYELTYTLSGSLEDVIEMAQDQMPYIGSCFEELTEGNEFQSYLKYALDVTAPTCRETLNSLLSRPEKEGAIFTAGQGMPLALKYYLPALLMGPIRHYMSYMEYIRLLRGLSEAPEDREILTQVEGLMMGVQNDLVKCTASQNLVQRNAIAVHPRVRRQVALEKIHELERIVENWDPKDVGQCCNEYIRDGVLFKISSGKRLTERRVFLFDGLMVLCKSNSRRQSAVHQNHHSEYRLKEKFFIRKVEIVDCADTDELKCAFEIAPRQMQPVVLAAKSEDEKNSWMADLVMLNTRSMLERILDSILSDIERKHPLKLPPPELYKFAEPDCKENIILEYPENGGVPLIKGATIYKLVERLTYHIYADPKFVRTFLTTYRSFCSPTELLTLLIERFQIPDPSLVYEQDCCDTDKMQKNNQREDWKKYRKEYCQPVQFRVLNVLRHWVDNHFYDFERDPVLLEKLHAFLGSMNGKSMRKKWVDSVLKIVQRKKKNDTQRMITFAFDENPPPIEWHLTLNEQEFNILTLHPVEIARQLTILEFDLYRMIKPSELVGAVWTKKDKQKSSPNLLKMIKHTTNFTIWLEKTIVEAENYEERVAVINRIIEVMTVLNEINNFNGVLAIMSAIYSASVHRLKFALQGITQQNRKALEDCPRLDDHFKSYNEKLRSINPPCVPFLGQYLTDILHIEDGNPDFLPNTQLINFFKRRKVAEITGEIQQYQNQPYCYHVEPKIRNFLENLSPFGDMSEKDINNYLFDKSSEIEPKNCKQPPKFPRKWPNLSLKSPGVKPKPSKQSIVSSTAAISSLTLGASSKTTPTTTITTTEEPASSKKNDDTTSQMSENDFSVFAQVQIPSTGQNSPTLSPASPAAPPVGSSWWPNHSRSPSVSSVMSTASFRSSVPSIGSSGVSTQFLQQRLSHHQTTCGPPNSPGPHSPASPGPHAAATVQPEPHSPRLPSTPPPLPPRRRRDSTETHSPHTMQPALPPKDNSPPPPLPPRREPSASPNAIHHHGHHHLGGVVHHHHHHHQVAAPPPPLPVFSSGTLPRLNPTHTSQLHMRRHSTLHPHVPARQALHTNGAAGISSPQPPAISPRLSGSESSPGQTTPKLPPKPASAAIRSASSVTAGTMFQYPSTTHA